MVTASTPLTHANNDTNRNLVRIFSICLSTLVLSYTVLAFRQFLEQGAFDAVTLLTTSVRLLLGVAALVVVFNPPGLPVGWSVRSTQWAPYSKPDTAIRARAKRSD